MKSTKARAKKARAKKDSPVKEVKKMPEKVAATLCSNCGTGLTEAHKMLFVEEEIGRVFCSEACIGDYFKPDIVQLEAEYFRNLSKEDLPAEIRDDLAYLRWRTLKNPDETYVERTLSKDKRYTLISQFEYEGQPVWNVCICLYLRDEPSFLYLAFVSRDPELVQRFRRGEKIEKIKQEEPGIQQTDGLAEPWTQAETIRAHLNQQRREDDIPSEDFPMYEKHIEETLQVPDEVWAIQSSRGAVKAHRMYHFVRHYPKVKTGIWYIVVARETDEEDQIEILDAFPTRDVALVDQYRCGHKEIDRNGDAEPASRLIH